jgi:hypothetical protein
MGLVVEDYLYAMQTRFALKAAMGMNRGLASRLCTGRQSPRVMGPRLADHMKDEHIIATIVICVDTTHGWVPAFLLLLSLIHILPWNRHNNYFALCR